MKLKQTPLPLRALKGLYDGFVIGVCIVFGLLIGVLVSYALIQLVLSF